MSRHIFTLTAAAMLAGLASQGVAQDHGEHHHEQMFKNMDTNGDGQLSQDEMQAAFDSRFDEVDLNKDGSVSRDELTAFHQKRAETRTERMMKKFDANGDDALSKDEMGSKNPANMFKKMDADGNGSISMDEFSSAPMKEHKQ